MTPRSLYWMLLSGALLFFVQCKKDPVDNSPVGDNFQSIDSEPQRNGDPAAGRDYLINGDYISSGIPYDLFTAAMGTDPENVLNRSGDNAVISPAFTAIDHANGARVAAPNCLQCHGQKLMGQYIIGLGNSFGDFTNNGASALPLLDAGIAAIYGAGSDEAEAFARFRRGTAITGPRIITEVIGVNPADKLTQVLVAHRDARDLSWIDDAQFAYDDVVVPTDVPA